MEVPFFRISISSDVPASKTSPINTTSNVPVNGVAELYVNMVSGAFSVKSPSDPGSHDIFPTLV